jgi:hypothetical protein
MVSCQEPSPLKGSKQSLQRHPHDAALVNAHSFVSMGVEARCRPCHSTAHCRNMKRQPPFVIVALAMAVAFAIAVAISVSVAHHHCCCHQPLPLQLPSPIGVTVFVLLLLPSAIAIAVTLAVGHCRLRHCPQLQLSSLSGITVAVAIGHCQELLPRCGKKCI